MKLQILFGLLMMASFSACSSDSGAPTKLSGPPQVETSPVTAVTPTPTATPDPSEDPTPTPTPTPTPVTNGDWLRATNLAQSIFDVKVKSELFTHKIVVSYYDIDHLTANPADFSRSVGIRAQFNHPDATNFDVKHVTTSDPSFVVSNLHCVDSKCKVWTLTLNAVVKDSPRLSGSVTISHSEAAVFDTVTMGDSSVASNGPMSVLERAITKAYDQKPKTISGSVELFQVQNGFVQPYSAKLKYSCDGNYPIEYRISYSGSKIGDSVSVNAHYDDQLDYLDGALGEANVLSDGKSTLELNFKTTSRLQTVKVF